MQIARVFLFLSVLLLSGCSFYEESRIIGRTETELRYDFYNRPDFLLRDSYGNFEEGGEVALLKLQQQDCIRLIQRFGKIRPVPEKTREYDTFKRVKLYPTVVFWTFWTDRDGADTAYLLDKASCVLCRQAHFE